jgi:broad specificity phosphatase PhoE
MKLVLVPCGATEWHAEGRLLGRVELPLTQQGRRDCAAWAEQLRRMSLGRIYHSSDELATQTASAIAERLAVPLKALEGLDEVDVGLWVGLTDDELESRFESAHHELREEPLNVNPPLGESLSAAAERVLASIRKCIQAPGRRGCDCVGVVLRPLSFALARCALEGGDMSRWWELARDTQQPVMISCNGAVGSPGGAAHGARH